MNVETIRYYEREGILPEPPRTAAGYRQYSDVDRWRLAFIRRGKDLGFTLKEIAELLSVSPTTIETHRAHILQKLDVHNTAELVLYAVRRGVIS